MAGRLGLRMVLAGALVTLIVAAAFAVLLFAIADLRESTQLRRQTGQELVAATGWRYCRRPRDGPPRIVITRENRFLKP